MVILNEKDSWDNFTTSMDNIHSQCIIINPTLHPFPSLSDFTMLSKTGWYRWRKSNSAFKSFIQLSRCLYSRFSHFYVSVCELPAGRKLDEWAISQESDRALFGLIKVVQQKAGNLIDYPLLCLEPIFIIFFFQHPSHINQLLLLVLFLSQIIIDHHLLCPLSPSLASDTHWPSPKISAFSCSSTNAFSTSLYPLVFILLPSWYSVTLLIFTTV